MVAAYGELVTTDILIVVVFLGLIPAVIASRKGHTFVGWWIFGALILIVALPAALMAKDIRARCPACRETVQPDAQVCPHCRLRITPTSGGTSGPFSHIDPL